MKCTLNHYHISCADKAKLAGWYQKHLGFEVVADVEALGEVDGPLIVSGDGGKSGISIFTSREKDRDFKLSCIPAFEVSPEDFLSFYRNQCVEYPEVQIYDHRISFSIYLLDPIGTKIEIMSSQYAKVQALLAKEGIPFRTMNPSKDPAYQKI